MGSENVISAKICSWTLAQGGGSAVMGVAELGWADPTCREASWAGTPLASSLAQLPHLRMSAYILPTYGDFWVGRGLRAQ